MALVKVISDNLFSGANLQKLEVGAKVEVSNETAKRWVSAGLVEMIEDSIFEVATPGNDTPEQPVAKSKKDK